MNPPLHKGCKITGSIPAYKRHRVQMGQTDGREGTFVHQESLPDIRALKFYLCSETPPFKSSRAPPPVLEQLQGMAVSTGHTGEQRGGW